MTELEKSLLTIVRVDYCLSENGKAHHTSRYEVSNRPSDEALLVVRRGQSFVLDVAVSRNYDPKIDGMSMVFTLDGVKKPRCGHGTLVISPVLQPNEVPDGAWQTIVQSYQGNSLRITVTPAANAIVGMWRIEINTEGQDAKDYVNFKVDKSFYMIFNPWHQEDLVYLENESERQEYVLEETGLIWRGTGNQMSSYVWKYSQFATDILDCALHLVTNVGNVQISARNDPIVITRVLSAAVNSPDDEGVLMGNWTADYRGGKSPTYWVGSQKILQHYYLTKTSVKYGQCWVFAGVLTTVCRALGLPCRPVTNYESGHDTENSLTMDYFVDENGKMMEELNSDSVWNFHVWNEVWMKRPDLTADCHGWQVIDVTPQELSKGNYRLGPASVAAIKRGEIQRPYDNAFVFAEVNADKVFWRYNGPSQPLKLVRKDTDSIGQKISTKAVGKWEREDITDSYKYPEKSGKERMSMYKALQQSQSRFSRYHSNEEFNDIMFSLELKDYIMIGQSFSVVLIMKNYSNTQAYEASVKLRVEVGTYIGQMGDLVKLLNKECSIRPGKKYKERFEVSWEDYGPRILDQGIFRISCLATVKNINYDYFIQDNFCVRKPDIVIKLENEPHANELLKVTARFTNPLPIPLRRGKFRIEGPGLREQLKVKLAENVGVGSEAVCRFSMYPEFEGRATIAVKFYSKELDDVDGFIDFVVQPVPHVMPV
ncbi:annulin [Copidosoma floridanum]|uniref:annulin n=1 Tax=Copidosoma floridanum TaxID=29053 RepID=UPI0006C98033|nr:annulin [Copidosoma floridanum]